MVNSGSESDRESNSLTREGRARWRGEEVKESNRESVMRRRRGGSAGCVSSGKSVENRGKEGACCGEPAGGLLTNTFVSP